MNTRLKRGATLGLIPVLFLVLIIIGAGMFIMTTIFGGSRQLTNATDAGTLASAKNLLAIGLTSSQISNLPLEFQALGVDNSGAPLGVDTDTGLAASSAIFNIYAFNRAAGLTLLVALNAAEDGSSSAINNANALIAYLNDFGTQLNNDLANDPSFANAFENLSNCNQSNMLGGGNIELGNNNNVQFARVSGAGKANIYFNSAFYANDPTIAGWVNKLTVNTGTMSQINSRYNSSDPSAEAGQPFVKGYQSLDMNAITGVQGFSPVVYTTAISPQEFSHMIDQNRFSNSGVSSSCYAPNNAIQAQGATTDTRTNLVCTALACAMLAAADNQYPISMPYGWIRIKNNPDAVAANRTDSSGALPAVPYYSEFGESIFNQQLWLGAGGFGGIDLANNGVFCTEAYDSATNPVDPGPAGYSGRAELTAWITYNTTPCSDPQYKDLRGLDSRLNPSIQQSDGSYVFDNVLSPTPNMRNSANFNQTATITDMLGVTSIVGYCNSTMYVGGATPDTCQNNLNTWIGNYVGYNYGTQGTLDTGSQASGGLTNLEYLKGEVLAGFYTFIEAYYVQGNHSATTDYTLTVPQYPSGSKVYQRSDAVDYSSPSNYPTVAFGTVGTPSDLLNQLYEYNASCANVSDNTQWTNLSAPLGKLLQRCQQILPTVQPADIETLLSTYPIDLNQYQYIYLPAGANKLAISQSPPAYLKPYPEYANPGCTLPDSTAPVSTCQDSDWNENGTYTQGNVPVSVNIFGTAINTSIYNGGGAYKGDGNTDLQPYLALNGTLNTYDAVSWVSNSGRYYFLGELSFGNYVNGTAGTFIQPN